MENESPEDLNNGDQWLWASVSWEWWTILQLVSAIVGTVGNLLVICVIFRPKIVRRSTDTLIGALAVADFLTSVFLIPIPDILRVPPSWLGEFYCKFIFTSRPMWISVSASIFTLAVISVERFVAIAFPFRSKRIFSHRHTLLCIAAIWAAAFVLNSFAFFVFFVDSVKHDCYIRFPTPSGSHVLGLTSFLLVLVVPIIVMLLAQAFTVYILHRQSRKFLQESAGKVDDSHPSVRILRAKKRVIRLLFVVVLTFIVCWAPNQSAYLAFNLGLLSPKYLYGPVDRVLVVLAFCNSCANPIIYTVQHKKFRDALKSFLSCREGTSAPVFGQKFDENSESQDQEARADQKDRGKTRIFFINIK
ncbi:galanin receptor 2a-like [Diadema setosum]|uniref:galanin receptor 2a-like n=1 Tax=Diadema setosum TaxID=31175 RepID=UPI003B3BB44C